MQYVITALDFTDEDAINRRNTHREAHLVGIKNMADAGVFKSGGAILDDSGKMIGSTAHVEFSEKAGLDHWITNDPYTTGKVWEKVDIKPVHLFPMETRPK